MSIETKCNYGLTFGAFSAFSFLTSSPWSDTCPYMAAGEESDEGADFGGDAVGGAMPGL